MASCWNCNLTKKEVDEIGSFQLIYERQKTKLAKCQVNEITSWYYKLMKWQLD
jgi:hypothetical protein